MFKSYIELPLVKCQISMFLKSKDRIYKMKLLELAKTVQDNHVDGVISSILACMHVLSCFFSVSNNLHKLS